MAYQTKLLRAGIIDYVNGIVGYPDDDNAFTFADLRHEIKTIVTYARPHEISLLYADVGDAAPQSVAARLMLIMYDRFLKRDRQSHTGIKVVAPFLGGGYVNLLEAYVVEMAHLNSFELDFIDWIEHENCFTNMTSPKDDR